MDDGIGPVSDSPGCDAVMEDDSVCNEPCTVHVLGFTDETGMACFKSCKEHAPWVNLLPGMEVWAEHEYEEPCQDVSCSYALRLNAKWN